MPSMIQPPAAEVEELVAFLRTAEVRPGARVLDVPCGIGRRAYALAERGFHVTAVDANEVAVEGLRRRVPEELEGWLTCRTASKETIPGPPMSESFQVILCLDHALGRDSTGEDVAFLGRLLAHLAPEGFLLVDFLHRDFFAARPRPFAYHILGDLEQHEFRSFDPVSGVLDLTWKFYHRDGKDLRFRGNSSTRLKLLAPHEARYLLEAAGWNVEALYSGWNKEVVSPDHRKLLLVARPAARG
jgi:SAM-dependent methyltransferase